MSARRPSSLLGLVLLAIALPTAANAHMLAGEGGGFLHGFEHPLSGLDHMLAMFCVGLWGAQMGGRSVWSLPVAFPLISAGIYGWPLDDAITTAVETVAVSPSQVAAVTFVAFDDDIYGRIQRRLEPDRDGR